MKIVILLFALAVMAGIASAGGLPVITSQPQSYTGSPGLPATFSVVSANATSFQWRFNGADIPGATNSTLQIASPQTTNSGYYLVVAKNATGSVPSQLAYLAVVAGSGSVPFSNQENPSAQAFYQVGQYGYSPITNGTARVVAGPDPDQMKAVGIARPVVDGYFDGGTLNVPTVAPGETVFYRVDISYPYESRTYTQHSRVLALVAGGGLYPVPSTTDLRFPVYIEWPDPYPYWSGSSPTNQVRVPGETFSLSNAYYACYDFGPPQFQWRKDGTILPGATNAILVSGGFPYGGVYQTVLTITNAQAADTGDYDVVVTGSYCFVDLKTTVSLQLANGQGVLVSPRTSGSQFVCDLLGAASRSYAIQWSSNLSSWEDLQTLSNATGTVTFTNALAAAGARYYRAKLLP